MFKKIIPFSLALVLCACGAQPDAMSTQIQPAPAQEITAAESAELSAAAPTIAEEDIVLRPDDQDMQEDTSAAEAPESVQPVEQVPANEPAQIQTVNNGSEPRPEYGSPITTMPGNPDVINEKEIKKIVLEHAGVEEKNIQFFNCKFEIDDMIPLYEIEFMTKDNIEYDYEVDAKTGEVLQFEFEKR